MRDQRIIVSLYEGIIVTLARTVPLKTTIIVKNNNGTVETMDSLKQRQYGLLNQTEVLPIIPQPPFSF
jgi:hypothetical protein